MRILIDADGCPVVQETISLAQKYEIEVLLVYDNAHQFEQEEHVQLIICDKGRDSADFALLKILRPDDLLITQDYGLAQLALTRNAYVLNQNGFRYSHENIAELLEQRAWSAKLRRHGVRGTHMKKRTIADDEAFITGMICVLEEAGYGRSK